MECSTHRPERKSGALERRTIKQTRAAKVARCILARLAFGAQSLLLNVRRWGKQAASAAAGAKGEEAPIKMFDLAGRYATALYRSASKTKMR